MPHTGLLINDDNFLPEMREELDVINRQVESYNDELSLLRSMSAQFLKCGNQKLYSYLSGYNHLISEADASYAEKRAAFRILEEGHGPDRCTVCDV
nr:hypothetical protein [Escherichia coli]